MIDEIMEKLMRMIWEWQINQSLSPLTCGNNSNHLLMPVITFNGALVLACPEPGCKYFQGDIPAIVFQNYEKMPDLEYLIGKADLFPGSLTQKELTRAEELIKNTPETDEDCVMCQVIFEKEKPNKRLDGLFICRQHALYMIHRDNDD